MVLVVEVAGWLMRANGLMRRSSSRANRVHRTDPQKVRVPHCLHELAVRVCRETIDRNNIRQYVPCHLDHFLAVVLLLV